MADVELIRLRALHVSGVNPQQDRPLQVVWKNRNTNVQITGTSSNFLEVRGFRLAEGRMFTDVEDRAHARVAVLGSEVLPLLGVDNPLAILDERIRIAGRQFTVVGILAARGVSGVGDADQQVLIPFSTGRFQIVRHRSDSGHLGAGHRRSLRRRRHLRGADGASALAPASLRPGRRLQRAQSVRLSHAS